MSTSESFRLLSNQLKYYLISKRHFVWNCLIVIVLAASLFILLAGFLNPIEDHHSFRQTQVAITIYWMITEDLFSYIVPVTLPPWNVPRELPLYQFMVAVLCKLFNLPIEPCARFVSITFFYLSSFYFFKVTKLIFCSLVTARLAVVMFLLSPMYLFWSRACMIESLALFLGLCFMYNAMIMVKKSRCNIIALIMFGILAALVKITTFYPIILFVFFYCLLIKAELLRKKKVWFIISSILTFCCIWCFYCFKARQFDWLFNESGLEGGKWISGFTDRIQNLHFFQVIFWEISSLVLPTMFLLLPFALFRLTQYHCISLILSFVITIFSFANLYYQHDYYIYGSGFILIILFSYFTIILLKKFNKLWISFPVIFLCALICSVDYTLLDDGYYDIQNNSKQKYKEIYNVVESLTNPSEIGLLCGSFCNPTLPYNLRRKMVTLPGNYIGHKKQFETILLRIHNHCISFGSPIKFVLLPNLAGYEDYSEVIFNQFNFKNKLNVSNYLFIY